MRMFIIASICLAACTSAAGVEPFKNMDTECIFKFDAKPACTYKMDKYAITVSVVTKSIAENEIELTQASISYDGKKQILDISPDVSMMDGATGIVQFDDINFDGMPDLAISTSFGVANQYFDYWVHDREGDEYKFVGNFPKFTINKINKMLEATVKLNATSYEKQIYRWQGIKLIRKK